MGDSQLADRALSLLNVSSESREVYFSKFPIVLPCWPGGLGKLRIMRSDVLYILNLDELLAEEKLRII